MGMVTERRKWTHAAGISFLPGLTCRFWSLDIQKKFEIKQLLIQVRRSHLRWFEDSLKRFSCFWATGMKPWDRSVHDGGTIYPNWPRKFSPQEDVEDVAVETT